MAPAHGAFADLCDIAAMSQQGHRGHVGAASRPRCIIPALAPQPCVRRVLVAAMWDSPSPSDFYRPLRWILGLINEVCRVNAVREPHASGMWENEEKASRVWQPRCPAGEQRQAPSLSICLPDNYAKLTVKSGTAEARQAASTH